MKLREILTISALLTFVALTYGYVQEADARAAKHEQEIWTGKVDK